MAVAAAIVLLVVAAYLGQRELASYRRYRRARAADETDLFVYDRKRLGLRGTGVATTFALGLALLAWVFHPPTSASSLSTYLAIFATLTITLIAVVILDLMVTARTARPGQLRRNDDDG